MIRPVAFMIAFVGNLCRMTMPILQVSIPAFIPTVKSGFAHIPTVGSLYAQIPTVHTLSAQFLPVLSYTFSRLLILGVQLSVRPRPARNSGDTRHECSLLLTYYNRWPFLLSD